MQSHSSPALSPSNSSSLLQYLHTAFHTSPEVDRRVGLPLSNVPTPNPRSPQLQPVDGDQLGIPELNSDSMGTPAVLTPRLLDVSSMELSNSGPELKASDSELKPTSADEIDRSSGNLNLALTEIKQLIKVYSKKLGFQRFRDFCPMLLPSQSCHESAKIKMTSNPSIQDIKTNFERK